MRKVIDQKGELGYGHRRRDVRTYRQSQLLSRYCDLKIEDLDFESDDESIGKDVKKHSGGQIKNESNPH